MGSVLASHPQPPLTRPSILPIFLLSCFAVTCIQHGGGRGAAAAAVVTRGAKLAPRGLKFTPTAGRWGVREWGEQVRRLPARSSAREGLVALIPNVQTSGAAEEEEDDIMPVGFARSRERNAWM